MEKEKKERLILYGSIGFIMILGLTTKLVKFKNNQVVTSVKIKPKKIVEKTNDYINYTFQLPIGYILKVDDNGCIVGYKEYNEEEPISLRKKFVKK